MSRDSDIDIGRLVRGDEAAWCSFVDRFSPVIYSAVWRVLRARLPEVGEWDVKDVVQSVFVRLVKADYGLLKSYDPSRSSPVTWLTIVARSVAIDFLRRRAPLTVPLGDREREIAVPPELPASPIDVPAGLLSARQRLVLRLLFDEGMEAAEIAGLLGVDAQTIRSTRHKAMKKLRRFFGRRE